jgi:NADH:ubiquinone oxidoreductase subunit H
MKYYHQMLYLLNLYLEMPYSIYFLYLTGVFFNIIFITKLLFIVFIILWARGSFPRYRYDQLMNLGWKVFLPSSISFLIVTSSILFTFEMTPISFQQII